LRITLSDGSHVIASVNAQAQVDVAYDSSVPTTIFDGATSLEWLSLGFPSQDATGALTFLGTVKPDGMAATLASNTALFLELNGGAAVQRIVKEGDPAFGAEPARFAAFLDPVNATGVMAFLGTLRNDRAAGVSAANNQGLWRRSPAGVISLTARTGDQAPETASGVIFKGLQSVAFPEGIRGPLFTAKIGNRSASQPAGRPSRVSAANQSGLWGVDAAGQPRLLARTGQLDETSRVLKKFDVFPAVPGSSGQTRSFNRNGEVIYLGTHTDGTQSISIVQAP
jgi:hypothetical protein